MLRWNRFSPCGDGNCGCPTEEPDDCIIFADDYATDQLEDDDVYHVVAGEWTVADHVLSTDSSEALLVPEASNPAGHGRASVMVKASTLGSIARLCGSYVNPSTYLCVELHINGTSSWMKLIARTGGSETQLGETFTSFTGTVDTWYELQLCWDGEDARALFGNCDNLLKGTYSSEGEKVALAAFPASGGTVTFDNLEFLKHHEDDASCPECGEGICTCIVCEPEYLGDWEVEAQGIANGTCTDCASLNGLYIIRGPIQRIGSVGCFLVETQNKSCDCKELHVGFADGGGLGDFTVITVVFSNSIGQSIRFYQNIYDEEHPIDCENFEETIGDFGGVSICLGGTLTLRATGG
jgi:hypothetical protein